ncbi:sugar phosphate isomerase/epimerase family protein [Salibacterium aidingense]|uniref:sugar phosphate isomerase/epimerase family protein n=1 Tax=Salibacterium aidingense TaxID=384933 RepID=UPI003BEAD117
MADIFINTVLLEKNRWEPGRPSSLRISEWMEDFQRHGFRGVEIWENHALQASETEVRQVIESPLPIEIYNSYISLEDEYEKERKAAAAMIHRLGVKRVKFNFGASVSQKEEYMKNLLHFKSLLPQDCELLCECHPGTILEEPAEAEKVFKELALERLGAIIHPFHVETDPGLWLQHLGSAVTHAHISLFDGGTFFQLKKRPEFVKERIRIMKEAGFGGTLSLEFTEGTASVEETPEKLYQHALEDLAFLLHHDA